MSTSTVIDPANMVCTLVEGFLVPEECAALIARLEAAGIGRTAAHYPPSYRNNDRLVLDDPQLAAALYPRIAEHAPEEILDEESGTIWRRAHLNPRFRCCRYRDGQCFAIHRDGVYHESTEERSRLTFMIYLNDGSEFQGGATRYYHDRSGAELLRSVTPKKGACIIFDHALWHDGEAVHAGTKYVLRSDLIYRKTKVTSIQNVIKESKETEASKHLGYIWSALLLSNGTLASAGRDQTLRIHSIDLSTQTLCELQTLRGHDSSVGCLAEAGGFLFSGDRQGNIRRWRRKEDRYQLDFVFRAHDGATLSLLRGAHPQHGECLISAGADGVIRFFKDTATPIHTIAAHNGWIWSLAASDDALFSCGEDGTVRRHDLGNSTIAVSTNLGLPLHSLLMTRDQLLVGCSDGRIVALAPRTLDVRFERRPHRRSLRCMIELGDGRIATGSEDDTVALWTSDLLIEQHRAAHGDFVRALVELSNGALLSGSYDGSLRFFSPPAASVPPGSRTSRTPTRLDPLSP